MYTDTNPKIDFSSPTHCIFASFVFISINRSSEQSFLRKIFDNNKKNVLYKPNVNCIVMISINNY